MNPETMCTGYRRGGPARAAADIGGRGYEVEERA
jgi:hypothetical protein